VPEQTYCNVCGDPLGGHNKSGICSDHTKTDCMRERKRREAIAAGVAAHRIKISIGDTFGRWTALEDYGIENKRILVRCECGTDRRVSGTYLVRGNSASCGCSRRKPRWGKPPYLLAGTACSRLTALCDVVHCEDYARFSCECGGEITTKAVQVKLGHTRSCGCIRRENRRTHGFTGHPLADAWHGIIQRCTNPNAQSWHNYGGRGITVCDRWLDPWLFAEDIERLGPRPVGYSLDRIDNEKGYFADNVRWADRRTQRTNQRTIADLTQERDALVAELAALKAPPSLF
jgi:hypothetical protein